MLVRECWEVFVTGRGALYKQPYYNGHVHKHSLACLSIFIEFPSASPLNKILREIPP